MRRSSGRRARAVVLVTAAGTLAAVSLAGIAGAQQEKNPPVVRSIPTISGEAREERVLTARNGEWDGKSPITFAFQWRLCAADGTGCADIAGQTSATYTVRAADVNKSIRVRVTATNTDGSATAASRATPAVVSKTSPAPAQVGPPVVRSLPTVEGEAREEKTLTARTGEWDGRSPIAFAYQWRLCKSDGTACADIAGQTAPNYTVRVSDVNNTLRVRVTAANPDGSATAASNVTPVVVSKSNPLPPGSPLGAVRLASGMTSVPASSVSLPNRLVVSSLQFSPPVVRSRAPFSARFRVTDTRGFAVRDALVRVIGVPYSRIRGTSERATDVDGWALIRLTPTARLTLQNGYYITMFVRARKQGDDLLAGVSTRRLVQIRLGRPAR
jgi:hypothetical protein